LPAIYAGLCARGPTSARRELLTGLGLGERLWQQAHQLSGGQQQNGYPLPVLLMKLRPIISFAMSHRRMAVKVGKDVLALLKQLHQPRANRHHHLP